MLARKRRLCCTGTACTANWASVRASTPLVVAFTLLGNVKSCMHMMQTVERGILWLGKQALRRQAHLGRQAGAPLRNARPDIGGYDAAY